MRGFKLMTLLCLLVLMAGTAEAKWWIFGSSAAEVSTRYIYINDLSYDELGQEVTLYTESLPQGEVVIRGRGHAGKNRIGAVQISLDGKQSWNKATIASDGSFVYRFTPDVDRTYELFVKVLDTTGKSNDVEASRKVISISDESIQDQVYLTLDSLIKAYREEDSFAFMHLVSADFVNGSDILDSAIRQDFSNFDNIVLDYTINNITSARGGDIFVAISFNRMVSSSRTGETFTDHGMTDFVFRTEAGMPKIFKMKNPLIFGLSDASEVASGTVNAQQDETFITVSYDGTVRIASIDDGVTSGSGTVTVQTKTLASPSGGPYVGIDFSSGGTVAQAAADLYLETNLFWSDTGAVQRSLGTTAIESITSVPASGYNIPPINVSVGDTYAIMLADGTYAVIQFTGSTDDGFANTTVTFKYKYQADGSTNF